MRLSTKEQDNLLRWDGRRPGWYEAYFLKWNDANSNTAGWIRYTLTSPLAHVGDPWCELWGIFFDIENPDNNFAVKQRYPIDQLSWDRDRFGLRIAEACLSMNACQGSIVDQARSHSIKWELEFDSSTPTFYHFPWPKLYQLGFPKTKVLAPHLDANFSGKLVVDGRTITIHNAPGEQEHLWGTRHAHRHTWGHCNTFEQDPSAVWEGLDAQVRLGPVPSPHLKLFYLKTGSREYLFNSPLQLFRNHSVCELGSWDFALKNSQVRIIGQLRCSPRRYVGVTYTDPDGQRLFCANSKVASIRLELLHPDGSRLGKLHSPHGCALEHVDRSVHPLVPTQI